MNGRAEGENRPGQKMKRCTKLYINVLELLGMEMNAFMITMENDLRDDTVFGEYGGGRTVGHAERS